MLSSFQNNRIVKCYNSPELSEPFVGKVNDVVGNYAIVAILDYDPSDRHAAYQINYTARVKISDIVPLEVRRHSR